MGGEDIQDLQKFIRPYPPEVQNLALWLREWVWELYPGCNEFIYDNYSAVAFGWSLTDRLGHTFCSVALMPKYVHFKDKAQLVRGQTIIKSVSSKKRRPVPGQ